MILLAGSHKFHEIVCADGAVFNLEIGDDAAEGIEYRVKYERLQRSLRVAGRRRHALDDGAEYLLHTHAGLAAGVDYLVVVASKQLHYLV